MSRLYLVLSVVLAGCGGSARIGEACGASKDCASKLCLGDPFPGGYCTADCGSAPCAGAEVCTVVGPYQVCLKACATGSECRAGYQCFQNACQPPCSSDDDCGKAFTCNSGTCTPRPGSPLGAACVDDTDCSSQLCLAKKCVQGCERDADCAATETCFINPVGDGNKVSTTHITPICIPRRGASALGAACVKHADCDRGSCELGMCTEMCKTNGDCTRSATGCADMFALVDNHSGPAFKGCLPSNKTVDFDGTGGQLGLPSTAQSMAIYSHLDPFDFNTAVGVVSLTDPTGAEIYTPPQTTADFYAAAIRYEPTEGSSTMLVPDSPRLTLMPGLYRFTAVTSSNMTPTVRVYLKLHDGVIADGALPLNIYYTDLSGSCRAYTFQQIKNGSLASATGEVTRIFQQANVNVSSVNFIDVSASAPNTIKVNATNSGVMLPDLDNLLAAATAKGTTPGLDVVLVRSITDEQGKQSGVLGIAGGIPSNPVLGTQHSGAAVSIETLCFSDMTTFASTMAHETSHTLGLYHNIEQDSSLHDPLTDTTADGKNNLMYWLEDSGEHLTSQQGQVIRNDPKVQ